jgi:hypothetical protein
MYSLDTVGRNARLGSAGTSKHAVRLLGSWLNSYRLKKFSVHTKFLKGEKVNFKKSNKISQCLKNGGVALCKIILAGREEHYLLLLKIEECWAFFFDPYYRKMIRGMGNNVFALEADGIRSPNLKIRVEWIEKDSESNRFCLGPVETREGLLIWRDK